MNEELTPEQEALKKETPPGPEIETQKENQKETQEETQEENQEENQEETQDLEQTIQKELNIFTKMREELKAHLKTYNNESAAYNSFQKCTDIGRKTLQNFLNGKTIPWPSTVLGFYKWYFKTKNEHEVLEKLSPETKWFLINNGYNTNADKQDICGVIFRSETHYELYLMTEDGQIIKKSQISKRFGERGLEVLSELALHEIIHAIDEEHFTTGKIRADLNADYYRNASSTIAKSFSWITAEENNRDNDISYFLGNLLVSLKDKDNFRKTVRECQKKLLSFHNRALKEKHSDRETFIISQLLYRPSIQGEAK